jgi:dTDP-glucose 4,6-dehydratase
VAKKIIDCWGQAPVYTDYIDADVHRAGQDVRYAIDDSKIKALGWTPKAVFDTELKLIVDYYLKNFVW